MNEIYDLPGTERIFDPSEIIVSKTDTKGIITYANDVFLRIADYTEQEVMGKPHNIIRHDFMPKCIYKLFWANLQAGQEIFAYVVNRTKNNDYYWVLAHVSPTYDADRNIIGYHSNRRVPNREALRIIAPLYKRLKEEEAAHATKEKGLAASYDMLVNLMREQQMRYDMFIYKLQALKSGESTMERFHVR